MLLVVAGLVLAAGGAVFVWEDIAAWYEFRQLFERLGVNEGGAVEYRHRATGIVFVGVPGGTARLGSPEGEDEAWESERPAHEARVTAFLIAKHELSQEEWRKVMRGNPAENRGRRLPVENVSWFDCLEFNRKTGFDSPTEAEWEVACRAGTRSPFVFGETLTTREANFNPYTGDDKAGTYRRATVAVDALAPSKNGLHGIHGNVAEWCEDVYDEDFYKKPEARETDPVANAGSGNRSVRGGSWRDRPRYCRSASRGWEDPSRGSPTIGYRPVYRHKGRR